MQSLDSERSQLLTASLNKQKVKRKYKLWILSCLSSGNSYPWPSYTAREISELYDTMAQISILMFSTFLSRFIKLHHTNAFYNKEFILISSLSHEYPSRLRIADSVVLSELSQACRLLNSSSLHILYYTQCLQKELLIVKKYMRSCVASVV
jgi:hypothetical protein